MATLNNGKTVSLHINPRFIDTNEPGALSKILRDLANDVDQWEDVDTGVMEIKRNGNNVGKIVVANPSKPTWQVLVGNEMESAYKGTNEAQARSVFEIFRRINGCLLCNGKIVEDRR